MKTLPFLIAAFLFIISCHSDEKTSTEKVTFGIHEIVKKNKIPNQIIDTMKARGLRLEQNKKGLVIGYIATVDSMFPRIDLTGQNFKIVTTVYPVDIDKKYYAAVAVKRSSIINNSNIKKTKVKGNNVEIYFNWKGAKKWANFTKQNIGNSAAFIINNHIYTMPEINGEIKNGIAIINGLSNEIVAKNISKSLNSSIPD